MRGRVTGYDGLLARRAIALGAAFAVVLFATIVSTDDGGVAVGARLGRFASLVALAGGLAAFVTVEQARSRGEIRGLHAIGVAPARAPLGAALGGTFVAAVGPLLAAMSIVDIDSLYPRLGSSAGTWAVVGPGMWRQVFGAAVVRGAGEIDVSPGVTAGLVAALPHVSRASTIAALLAFAIALPLWATARGAGARRLVVALLVAVSSVTLFHLVAVARAPSALLVVPPLALLVDAWALSRSGAWT
jgi:hypothetical protein